MRRPRRGLLLLPFIVLLAGAATMPGEPLHLRWLEIQKDGVGPVDGLDSATRVAVSPDGKSVYTTAAFDHAVAVFSRDPASGLLTWVEVKKDGAGGIDGLMGAFGVKVSPDGKHVLATGFYDSALVVFSRNASTSALGWVMMLTDGVSGVDGLSGPKEIAFSPDGKHVYVTGQFDNSVAVFTRDSITGVLTYDQVHKDGYGGINSLEGAEAVTVSPDGKHVYVAAGADDAVTVFSRDSMTGLLTYVEFHQDGVLGVDGLESPIHVSVSPDGRHVYVSAAAEDAVAVFSRDSSSGSLTFVKAYWDGVDGFDGLSFPRVNVVSPDGAHLLVVGSNDDALAVFARDAASGALKPVEVLRDGVDGVDGLWDPSGVAMSSDGQSVYVTSFAEDTLAVFRAQALLNFEAEIPTRPDHRYGIANFAQR
jgi:6-phosphogluconolactonase (cycloisomerase 2 family)